MSNNDHHHDRLSRGFLVERYTQVSASFACGTGAWQGQVIFDRKMY